MITITIRTKGEGCPVRRRPHDIGTKSRIRAIVGSDTAAGIAAGSAALPGLGVHAVYWIAIPGAMPAPGYDRRPRRGQDEAGRRFPQRRQSSTPPIGPEGANVNSQRLKPLGRRNEPLGCAARYCTPTGIAKRMHLEQEEYQGHEDRTAEAWQLADTASMNFGKEWLTQSREGAKENSVSTDRRRGACLLTTSLGEDLRPRPPGRLDGLLISNRLGDRRSRAGASGTWGEFAQNSELKTWATPTGSETRGHVQQTRGPCGELSEN
jgi:hypothetical protein